MADDNQDVKNFVEAFNIFSSNLGEDDIYKRILLEIIFEEFCKKNNKGNNHGSK